LLLGQLAAVLGSRLETLDRRDVQAIEDFAGGRLVEDERDEA